MRAVVDLIAAEGAAEGDELAAEPQEAAGSWNEAGGADGEARAAGGGTAAVGVDTGHTLLAAVDAHKLGLQNGPSRIRGAGK